MLKLVRKEIKGVCWDCICVLIAGVPYRCRLVNRLDVYTQRAPGHIQWVPSVSKPSQSTRSMGTLAMNSRGREPPPDDCLCIVIPAWHLKCKYVDILNKSRPILRQIVILAKLHRRPFHVTWDNLICSARWRVGVETQRKRRGYWGGETREG